MNAVQHFIDALSAELTARFGPLRYTVQVREPLDEELLAEKDAKQIFITTEGIEPGGDELADQGNSTAVIVPVIVSCVMQRPAPKLPDNTLDVPTAIRLHAGMLRRRLTLVQAVQRVQRAFAHTHSHVLTRFIQEKPVLINGFIVSITGVELEFHLDAEENL